MTISSDQKVVVSVWSILWRQDYQKQRGILKPSSETPRGDSQGMGELFGSKRDLERAI